VEESMRIAYALILATGISIPGLAQTGTSGTTAPAANPDAPSNPAINRSEGNNPGAPAAGANSFTEGQARSRLEKDGYTEISELTKDGDGLWRGKAKKGGQTVEVAVDYQGNIVPR
jgi:hypothetical protein